MKKLKKLWLVFTHAETKTLPLALLAATGFLAFMAAAYDSLVFGGLTLVAFGLLVGAIRESSLLLDAAEEQGLLTMAHSWAQDGETEDEVRERFDMVNGSKPMVNIDGTPMVGDVDIHGRLFGDVHTVGFNSVSDVGNNSFMDPSNSYHSPFGRD